MSLDPEMRSIEEVSIYSGLIGIFFIFGHLIKKRCFNNSLKNIIVINYVGKMIVF